MRYPARQPNSTRALGRTLEDSVAKSVGGRVSPSSGASPWDKGDVSTETHLIECKTTKAKSFRLELSVLDKIRDEAAQEMKESVLVVRFFDDNNNHRDFYVREVPSG